jgi:glycosyltransferase involved in cell wall biosynthesis
MKIALVTDAWVPQVNGVVRTLQEMVRMLRDEGHEVQVVSPDRFYTVPCPGYAEIRLVLIPWALSDLMDAFDPDAVHIATEGPLGWAARRWCKKRGVTFNSSFHTRFPDYVAVRTGLSPEWIWPLMRRFHAPSNRVLVATQGLGEELQAHGISRVHRWSRGVDLTRFGPDKPLHPAFVGLAHPIQLYVGRVAIEKNIEAFLDCAHTGSKVVVGDGPALESLRERYPDALFTGALEGEALAAAYASADVFIFPSLTDTFGLVMIEALASGVPVAGFPVHGPLDVVGADGCGTVEGFACPIGALDQNLDLAISKALSCSAEDCVAYAKFFNWENSYQQFSSAVFALAA